jgi:hypothetical protein
MEGWPANDPSAPISRERQIELMQTAEERVKASLEYWRSKPKVQRALRRPASVHRRLSRVRQCLTDVRNGDQHERLPMDFARGLFFGLACATPFWAIVILVIIGSCTP